MTWSGMKDLGSSGHTASAPPAPVTGASLSAQVTDSLGLKSGVAHQAWPLSRPERSREPEPAGPTSAGVWRAWLRGLTRVACAGQACRLVMRAGADAAESLLFQETLAFVLWVFS